MAKSYGKEEVLGTPREVVDDIFAEQIAAGGFTAFWQPSPNQIDFLLAELTGAAGFKLRDEAEQDFTFKQIIPYCLVVYSGSDGDVILHYSRVKSGSTEQRLAGKRSIGVGGHINPEDFSGPVGEDSYMKALQRELEEEFSITNKMVQDIFTIGFVNDEENEVGQVHIGVVHVVVLNTVILGKTEEHLTDPQWDTPYQAFLEENMETWSSMVLRELMPKIELDPWHLSRASDS